MSTIASTAPAIGRAQSIGEEFANTLTHGIAALASLGALPILVGAAMRDGLPVWPYAVFGLSLVALFAASASYHAATSPALKRRLRSFDHSSIYVLIAGSYSAYSISLLGGSGGWTLFGLEWAIAAAGIAMSFLRIDRFRAAGPIIYIAMGWLIAPFWGSMRAAMPSASFALLIAGGGAYTLGVAFFALKRVPYFHVVWHLFVIAGAACHVASLFLATRP